jgi:hypothetical protein
MFNLLPEIEKKNIVNEYNTRRSIVALIFIFIVGLFSVISIIPSFILSSSRVNQVSEDILAIQQSDIFIEEPEITISLSDTNSKISTLLPEEQKIYVADIFERVISHKTSNIRINGITYRSGESGGVAVNGIARSREELSSFVEDMRKDSLFKEVNLPVSNFAKDRNAEFTLNIIGDF